MIRFWACFLIFVLTAFAFATEASEPSGSSREAGEAVVSSLSAPLFSHLSQRQRALFLTYVQESLLPQGAITGQKAASSSVIVTSEQLYAAWLDLPFTAAANFDAITHALETVHETVQGVPETGLDQVMAVTDIRGEIDGAAPGQEFNIAVVWKPGAHDFFKKAGYAFRTGWGHPAEEGISYHRLSYGLHLLFNTKNHGLTGHVHIDYRCFGVCITYSTREGHFGAYNADVTAVGPQADSKGHEIRNVQRYENWFGPLVGYLR